MSLNMNIHSLKLARFLKYYDPNALGVILSKWRDLAMHRFNPCIQYQIC